MKIDTLREALSAQDTVAKEIVAQYAEIVLRNRPPMLARSTTSQDDFCTNKNIIVSVSFYKNERLFEPLMNSLLACRDELAALRAEVLLYNDSPDYAPL